MDADERLARGDALVKSLEKAGCAHAVCLKATRDAGVGVFAARDVEGGGVLVRCPVAHAWYARDGDEFDDAIDALRVDGEPLDARERLQLHLLNERARSDVDKAPASDENLVQISRARYVLSLPGAELVNALPIGWSDEDIERRLRGDLLSRTRATLARIHAVADAIARSRSKAFGDADDAFFVFSVDDLKWAHAVFWSRAMTLRFPRKGFTGGGDVDALVPLVDMCNHRAGSTATLEIVEDDAGDAFYELRAGVATKAGDEVFINYGAKGNEELLRCHGFVIPNNPCDVLAVDLRKLWLWKGDVHWRGDVAASEAEAEARSISHWSPYDRVGVVNADP
jgi:hypothetical protein